MADITALIRKNSRQVINISKRKGNGRDPIDWFALSQPPNPQFWEQVSDPTFAPGCPELVKIDEQTGHISLVEGEALYHDSGTNQIRLATAGEIASFTTYAISDSNKQDAIRAGQMIDTSPRWRRLVAAIVRGIILLHSDEVDKINELVSAVNTAAGTSITPLSKKTFAQAKTYIKNQVSEND